MGLPGGSHIKNLPAMRETWVQSLGWKYPLEEGMATHSSILARRIPMDRGAWWAIVHGVAKSWTWLEQLSMHTRSFPHLCLWALSSSRQHLCNLIHVTTVTAQEKVPESNEDASNPKTLNAVLHAGKATCSRNSWKSVLILSGIYFLCARALALVLFASESLYLWFSSKACVGLLEILCFHTSARKCRDSEASGMGWLLANDQLLCKFKRATNLPYVWINLECHLHSRGSP